QAHGGLCVTDVQGAEIDLQRRMLELTKVCDDARNDRPDFARRAYPCTTRFDLAVEREGRKLAHGALVTPVVLGGGARNPIAHPFIECPEIFFERSARDVARETGVLVAEHMKGDHHFAVAGMARAAPCLAIC